MSTSIQEARALLLGDGPTRPKLAYFAIEGVAEQVRIALSVAGIPFDDVAIPFTEWQSHKSSTKFGQLPEMTLPDGTIVTDSMAMLRLAGEADEEGKLYPANIALRIKVESALGLVGDLTRAWSPALAISMRPERFGYPSKEEWTDADVIVKKLRVNFIENELPRFMQYFAGLVKENGGHFLTGEHLTIADISAYQAIHYFRRGLADHVPADCLEKYPEILEWMGRVEGHEKVAAYKASKQAK